MNPTLEAFLIQAEAVMAGQANDAVLESNRVQVGVDLGTAYTVIAVLDENQQPIAGRYQFAQIVRDGLIVDFHGAITLLTELKQQIENQLGFSLTTAATTYPPGVARAEVQATRHVLEAAGFICEHLIDEPTAANAVLQIEHGAVVDIGGGTTGIAIFKQGEVIYTADEPTGGTHFSLVVAGALDMPFEAAEIFKRETANHTQLFPLVRPVMEKVATIINRHVADYTVETLYLVGGSACFSGIAQVVSDVTGIETVIPSHPLFVTPFGVAMYDK
ncbi:MAG: ethanolamine utilization protein EutJ [Chloroflexota bacterium]